MLWDEDSGTSSDFAAECKRGRRRPNPVLDPYHGGEEPIAADGDGLNTASFRSSLVEYATKGRNLDGQVGVLHRRPPPDGRHDLLLPDELTGPFDEHGENIEGARADRHWSEGAALIAPGQTLAPPIETKVLEQENFGRGEQPRSPVFSAGTSPVSGGGPTQRVLNSI
jgi:hypothetical protein